MSNLKAGEEFGEILDRFDYSKDNDASQEQRGCNKSHKMK